MASISTQRWRWPIMILIGVGVAGTALWPGTRAAAEEMAASSSAPRAVGRKPASSGDQAKVDRKLEEILKNQQTIIETQQAILKRFDAVMEELRIVKVRASAHGGS